MFTGLIRQRGRLRRLNQHAVFIEAPGLAASLGEGDSVAVNGVCLTAVRLSQGGFEADLLDQTLANTTLGQLAEGTHVNLETALRVGDEIGGHQLLGHVDGTAGVVGIEQQGGGGCTVAFELPAWLRSNLVVQGSVGVDGVSLTVQSVSAGTFSVGLIPATLTATSLRALAPGDRVNIEIDYLVKAVRQTVEQLLPAMLADRGQDWSQAASNPASEEP